MAGDLTDSYHSAMAVPLLVAALAFSIKAPSSIVRPTEARVRAVRCSEPDRPEPAAIDSESPELTKVGSKAYYEGFFTQPVDETVTAERGDGTEQAVKFAASSFGVIAVLLLGFLASNGLL